MSKKIVNAIFEMFEATRTPRSGWQRVGVSEGIENVAEHTCLTAQIAFILAIMEGENLSEIVCEALFHDNGEPRTGDRNKLNARYFCKSQGERKAFEDFTSNLPPAVKELLLQYFDDFEEGKSVRAKIVRDADLLQMAFQAKFLLGIGYKFANVFLVGVESKLQTTSAKDIYKHLLGTDFFEWSIP